MRLVKECEVANSAIYAKRCLSWQNLVAGAVAAMSCKALIENMIIAQLRSYRENTGVHQRDDPGVIGYEVTMLDQKVKSGLVARGRAAKHPTW